MSFPSAREESPGEDTGPGFRLWPPVAIGVPLVLGLLVSGLVGDPFSVSPATTRVRPPSPRAATAPSATTTAPICIAGTSPLTKVWPVA